MNFETFDRMDGLANSQDVRIMIVAMKSITQQLLQEGFDDHDIMEFMSHYAEVSIDDTIFEINEWTKK
jgi:hypothetical protein